MNSDGDAASNISFHQLVVTAARPFAQEDCRAGLKSRARIEPPFGSGKRDQFAWSRAATFCLSMSFLAKPVLTFAGML
jgi:hypothetical protein